MIGTYQPKTPSLRSSFLRKLGLSLVALVILVPVFYAIELWRGKAAWTKVQTEAVQKSWLVSLEETIPPSVPDAENFAMTPLLKPIYPAVRGGYATDLDKKLDWLADYEWPDDEDALQDIWTTSRAFHLAAWQKAAGGDVLAGLKIFDREMAEIASAVRRPYSRFPLEYEKGYAMWVRHVGILDKLTKLYELRALAELNEGRADAAVEDAVTLIRLSAATTGEATWISQLFSKKDLENSLQVVWEGLERHQWSDAQLVAMDKELMRLDYFAGMKRAQMADTVQADRMLEGLTTNNHDLAEVLGPVSLSRGTRPPELGWRVAAFLFPRGWIYQSRAICVRTYLDWMACIDFKNRRADTKTMEMLMKHTADLSGSPESFLADIFLPNIFGTRTMLRGQEEADLARVACALERYRLAQGQWPETLEQLAPRFIDKVPMDVVTGEPLHYHTSLTGRYVLYGVGWNRSDDGGVRGEKDGQPDMASGDWIWPQQVPAKL